MRTQVLAFAVMAMSGLAFAGSPYPSGKLHPSPDPDKCLERLDEYPNRSESRPDLFFGRCVKARTYTGKYGPYNGDFFLETCCKNEDEYFTKPTYVNLDECLVYDRESDTLQWNSDNERKLKEDCRDCELESIASAKIMCQCTNVEGEEVGTMIKFGQTDPVGEKESHVPKDAFWVNEKGELVCKKE